MRKSHAVDTAWGPIEGKIGWLDGDVPRFTPEFDACRRIALEHNLPLGDVYEAAQKAFDPAKAAEK